MPRLTTVQREKAICMLPMGATQRAVAISMNCSKMTISRLVTCLRQTCITAHRSRSGRPNVTTPQDDRYLRVLHLTNRFLTVTSSAANSLGHLVRACVCAFNTCQGMRCLETRAGKTSCIKGGDNQGQNQTTGNTILIDACRNGDLKQVKCILSQDTANINTRGENGVTPAMIAAEKGEKDILELLVKKGSDLSLLDEDDNNILHLACKGGHVDIVKYIHSRNIVDIDRGGENGYTPLMIAVQFGNMDVFSFLMRKGADTSTGDAGDENILHLSCRGGNVEIVNYILKQNIVDINSERYDGMTPLFLTVQLGMRKVFQLLTERGAYAAKTTDSMELLNYACEGGDLEIMKRVLNLTNVDINIELWDGITPLLRAAHYGNSELFKFLVTKGANMTMVDSEDENVLHFACRGESVEIVKYIITQNILNMNAKQVIGMTPVMLAASLGYRGVFECLVEEGADISIEHVDGNNILHLACIGGSVEIVKCVLAQNIVDINSKGEAEKTPVMLAASSGYGAVFECLVEEGADISVENVDGDNILHLACRGGNVEIVKYVLAQNIADINSKGDSEMTPVLIAATLETEELSPLLIERGADLYTTTKPETAPFRITLPFIGKASYIIPRPNSKPTLTPTSKAPPPSTEGTPPNPKNPRV
ncbi:putative ankyrin repeat protein RF_0381 [Haliotis cracherodii]|uniref:putative ankyrin repeat protein RF_0381 n=1 Tax=Haliotis cracherodii TaxID=6455 RepID=UPI0039ED7990